MPPRAIRRATRAIWPTAAPRWWCPTTTSIPAGYHARSDRSCPLPSAASSARNATVRLELDCGPEAAAAARAAISMLHGCAPRELLDDARLLTSEIATNAVRHSGAPTGSVVDLEVYDRARRGAGV